MREDEQRVDLTPILLIAILVLAVFLRLLYFTELSRSPFFRQPILDAQYYTDWAEKLAWSGFRSFPEYQGNPLYPHFLAFFFRAFGTGPYLPRLVQHTLGVFTCLLIYLTGKTLFRPGTALLAAFLYALYIPAVFYEGWMLSASLAAFLTAALLALLLYARQRPGWSNWLIGGGLAGLLTLIRPSLIPLGILLWIAAAFRADGKGRRLCFLFLTGLLLVLALYPLQNYLRGNDWTLLSPHGGANFYIGNNPEAIGTNRFPDFARSSPAFQHLDFQQEASRLAGRPLSPAEASRFWFREGVRFASSRPDRFAKLLLYKIVLFFSGAAVPDNYNLEFLRDRFPVLKIPFTWQLLSTLGLLGLLVSLKVRKGFLLLYLFVLSYSLSISLFFVTDRFRLPLAPVLALSAAYLFSFLQEKIERRKWLRAGGCVVAGVLIYLFLGRPTAKSFPLSFYLSAGDVYYRDGEYDRALTCLRKAGEGMTGKYEEVYHLIFRLSLVRGQAYLGSGKLAEAEESFNRLLEDGTAPLVETYFEIANSYAAHEYYDRAIEYYRLLLENDGENYRALNNLGLSLKALEDPHGAERAYRRALEIRPDYAAAHTNLGNLYLNEGKYGAALKELRMALALDPGQAALHLPLAICLRKLNRIPEAEAEWRKCPAALRRRLKQ